LSIELVNKESNQIPARFTLTHGRVKVLTWPVSLFNETITRTRGEDTFDFFRRYMMFTFELLYIFF